MLMVQDQYVQNSRKNFDSEFHFKQNTSKQVYSDPKEVWEIESGCEEEIITSGNETEGEEQNLYVDSPQFPEEIFQTRQIKPRKKNVRFGENYNFVLENSETSSIDNEYFDCGYLEGDRRKSLNQEPEINGCKGNDHFRVPKTKWRNLDCGFNKTRPRSVPEKFAGYSDVLEKRQINLGECERTRRKEHRYGKYHCKDFDDVNYRKPLNKGSKFECGDEAIPRCCDHCLEKKTFVKMKPMSIASHKHVCHMTKDADRYYQEDYFDRGYSGKGRKKALDVVQEQQEQFSDSTYKVPCSKFSSHSVAGELTGCPRKGSTEKLINSSMSDWLYYGGRGDGGSSGHQRINKMRSRRTRINKIKNGWKKALVQTVRDGNRNERVGVIVMGSKGPEFYTKNAKPCEFVPFRKTKSFLDGASTSFEVMTVDCKNVFLSSSEPGPRVNHTVNELTCPEEDLKMEEKIAMFSKNVNDIVRHSEEKFYKALSCSDYPERKAQKGEGDLPEEDAKKDAKKDDASKSKFSCGLFPFDSMSPRVPKSLRKSERKVSLDSKAMADALNEQAKQYIENQLNLKDKEDSFLEGMKELKEKYPPKELSQETIEANLSLWGMKLDQLSENNEIKEQREETDEKPTEKARREKEDRNQTESVRSGNDKSGSNTQRRTVEEEVEAAGSKPHSHAATPKRTPKSKPVESPRQKHPEDADSNLISAMFRDLIKNGCAISQEESENLQSVFNQVPPGSNDVISSSSSTDGIKKTREGKLNVTPGSPKTPTSLEDAKKEDEERRKTRNRELENLLEEVGKTKAQNTDKFLTSKCCKKAQGKQKEGKGKRTGALEDKMKLLRQALPSLAAENEAAHLKQLKKYIDKFIGRVEASTNSEFSKRKEGRRKAKSGSTDSSEVRVDACKILDFVSDPFKKISSEVTINIAKKLTDTLVQDRSSGYPRKCPTLSKARKQSENETDDEGLLPCISSGDSDRCEESEPTYLKQLKKMRNEHLNNILLEVKRLSELLRFLDRCNRLHF